MSIITRLAFPTELHEHAASAIRSFFAAHDIVDTVLVVNSCARGHAIPESDLDMVVLLRDDATSTDQEALEARWREFAQADAAINRYKRSSRWAAVHLDVVNGIPEMVMWDDGGGPDWFEVVLGNHLAYSAAFGPAGLRYIKLRAKWLPYYDDNLRLARLAMARDGCRLDLDHVPFFVRRDLHVQAFDRLYKAYQEFLQAIFIAHAAYPLAYNKWIREQIVDGLGLPDLYEQLPAVISVSNLISGELVEHADALGRLLDEWAK